GTPTARPSAPGIRPILPPDRGTSARCDDAGEPTRTRSRAGSRRAPPPGEANRARDAATGKSFSIESGQLDHRFAVGGAQDREVDAAGRRFLTIGAPVPGELVHSRNEPVFEQEPHPAARRVHHLQRYSLAGRSFGERELQSDSG